jgi:hypothetical protein
MDIIQVEFMYELSEEVDEITQLIEKLRVKLENHLQGAPSPKNRQEHASSLKGDKGSPGSRGRVGLRGEIGPTGEQGPAGKQGVKGDSYMQPVQPSRSGWFS